MADNVAITAGTGTSIAADEVVDATLGTVKAQFIKIMDGTLDGTSKVAVKATAPATTDPGLVVAISPNGINANGLNTAANSAPVVIAPQTTLVPQTPTVSVSPAYSANDVLGTKMTFASIVPPIGNNGVLQSITAKFKDTAVTGNINVAIFKADPSNSTFTDNAAPTWNSADMANLLGIYQLATPLSIGAATMACYCLDGIGKAFVSSSTSLYAVVTVGGTPTMATTSSFTLELAVLPG